MSRYLNYTNPNSWKKIGGSSDVSVFNIGDGSAGVFAGTDSSGNILLRSIKGSGAATVIQTSEEIVIGIDASLLEKLTMGKT
ncbi:MAG: hypothetical protein HC831_11715 [Chloroflexia bacterium]|nr:hypothetical protein [Chloroflexia bacterium]